MVDPQDIVIVAEEHPLCRAGLAYVVEAALGHPHFVHCSDFDQVLAALDTEAASLLVIQYGLPGMSGGQGLRRVRLLRPSLRMVVVGDSSGREIILDALSAGAHGFVPKTSPSESMADALKAIIRGQIFVPPSVADEAAPAREQPLLLRADASLTPRQKQVLRLLAQGHPNKEIARELGLSEGTVKVHVNAAFRLLGVHNRVNAAAALKALGVEVERRYLRPSSAPQAPRQRGPLVN